MNALPDAHTHPAEEIAPGTAPLFLCGTSPADWERVALLAERNESVIPFFGIHPWFLNPAVWREEMSGLAALLESIPRAGIGETGLDKCRRGLPGLPIQREALDAHLNLATRLNRPVSLHCCRAWGTLAGTLKKYPRLKAVLHGWTGAVHPEKDLPSANWLLSVGAREMKRPGLLSSIPLHRLALESDEHPESLPELYHRAARELDMSVTDLANLVQDNLERLTRP